METWIIVLIIVIVIAFIISTMTALLKVKPFHFSEEYEAAKDKRQEAIKKEDDDDRDGLI
jgi:Na+-transporting methylmalonyl-CoA/oxaloacetate decarboxylase gamma subunit